MLSRSILKRMIKEDLEIEQAAVDRLRGNLRAAREELRNAVAETPFDQRSNSTIAGTLDQILKESEKEAAGIVNQSLNRGLDEGKQIVGLAAKVPSDSPFWNFVPILPTNAIALAEVNTISIIRNANADLKNRILREIQVKLSMGASQDDIRNAILGTGIDGLKGRDGVFRSAYHRAETIGRTVTNDLINRGSHITYSQINSINPELNLRRVWQSVSDHRTSKRCRSLNGQIVRMDEQFRASDGWTGLTPSAHPNCRSRVTVLSETYSREYDSRYA